MAAEKGPVQYHLGHIVLGPLYTHSVPARKRLQLNGARQKRGRGGKNSGRSREVTGEGQRAGLWHFSEQSPGVPDQPAPPGGCDAATSHRGLTVPSPDLRKPLGWLLEAGFPVYSGLCEQKRNTAASR